MCVHACAEARGGHQSSYFILLQLFPWDRVSHWTWGSLSARLADWPMSCWDMPFYTPFSQPSVRVPDTCSHTQLSCEWWGSNLKFSCLSSQVLLSTKASLQLSILVSLLCTMFLSAQANHLIASSLVGIKICSLENPILRSPYVYVLSGPMQSLVESVLARASALCLAL